MELNKQIKKYRMDMNLSQEELADRVYVTRQTISNWETGKNYPDIHSILLMSTLFHVSLDQFIKGDLEKMKKEISVDERMKFNKESKIFTILLLLEVILFAPLVYFLHGYGFVILAILFVITLYYSLKVEKTKKQNDIQTYKEIVAFSNGERLDEIEKNKEEGKRVYQKFLIPIGFGIGTFFIVYVLLKLFQTIT